MERRLSGDAPFQESDARDDGESGRAGDDPTTVARAGNVHARGAAPVRGPRRTHRDLPVTDITAAKRWLLAMGPAVRRREQRTRRRIGPGPAIERATFGRTIDTANVSICRF